MLLFKDKEREWMGPKSASESYYTYYNRSGRKEVENIRSLLNTWLQSVPKNDRDELINRLRSPNPKQFNSAIFEVVLFATFSALECNIEIHPTIPNDTGKKPDFRITTPDGEKFYVEAIVVSDEPEQLIGKNKKKEVVYDTINKMETENFFLYIDERGTPNSSPKGNKLKAELENWLNGLDPEAVATIYQDTGDLPKFKWEHDGWNITFKPIPIKKERRNKGQRVIGATMPEVRQISIWQSIRDAVKNKGRRYGKLDHPFLVAVNSTGMFVDKIDEVQALYGQEEFIINVADPGKEPRMSRKPNGAWLGPHGPQYKRVSGCWIFNDYNIWNLSNKTSKIYHHPCANMLLPEFLNIFPSRHVIEDKLQSRGGDEISVILNIPDDWPNCEIELDNSEPK
jgi:hypothetical protein